MNLKCVFYKFLYIFYEIFLILRRTPRDIVINVYGSSCKLPIVLSDYNKTEFPRWIFKKYSKIMFRE
jgi:hypothetical protein